MGSGVWGRAQPKSNLVNFSIWNSLATVLISTSRSPPQKKSRGRTQHKSPLLQTVGEGTYVPQSTHGSITPHARRWRKHRFRLKNIDSRGCLYYLLRCTHGRCKFNPDSKSDTPMTCTAAPPPPPANELISCSSSEQTSTSLRPRITDSVYVRPSRRFSALSINTPCIWSLDPYARVGVSHGSTGETPP